MKNEIKNRRINRIGMILALVLIAYYAYITLNFGYKWIDSDTSSELILGKYLAEENSLISTNWWYSTELRVLNTNIIYAFCWKIFSSYRVVRTVAQSIGLVILYIIQVYFYKKMKSKYSYTWSLILLLPFSQVYYKIVLFGLYYIPHICISFIILSLLISYIENSSKNQKIKLSIGIIISLLAGMGGLRQVFITSIPLIFMSILWLFKNEETWNTRDWKDSIKLCIKFNFIMGISAVIGLMINILYLSKIYKFQNQGNIKLSNFKFSNLENVINGFIEIFGFKNNTLISLSGIESLCALLLVCILLGLITFYSKKVIGLSSLNILVEYTVIANVLIIALYLFSSMNYVSRYLIPTAVFLIPTACLIIENINLKKIVRDSILFLLFISLIGVSMNTISINNSEDKTYKLRDVEKFLEQKELKFGYAEFWNANVITELSNGKIEMYPLNPDSISEDYNELKPNRWLVNEKILENKNSKNFFILVSMEDKDRLRDQVYYFSKTESIQYIDNNYCVYVFGDK